MTRFVYPGSFDPPTLGHLDLIRRASGMADEVVIGVLQNAAKAPLFGEQERVALLRELVEAEGLKNVRVVAFAGLLVEFARQEKATAILRGIRGAADVEFELQLAQMNRALAPEVETLLLPASPQYSHISSQLTKQAARGGGEIKAFVPKAVRAKVLRRLREQS